MGGISDCSRADVGSPSWSFRARVGRSTEVSAMPQPMQLAQIVAKLPCDPCSIVTYGGFYTNTAAAVAKCMKKCAPGNDALLLHF